MKITNNLLVKLQAYKSWFDILKKYPNKEAPLLDLLQDEDLDFEDLYFARHYFNFTDEELKVYNNRCHIEECGDHVLRSSYIKNSNWVYSSTNIENSNFISNCQDVKGSTDIKSAINVLNSANIINSKNIKYSENIADSGEISSSNNIINSSYISWSSVINSSHNLDECRFCYKSNNLQDCYFCGFTENSRHCLFCNNISNTEYQIFNKAVTIEEFELIKEDLLQRLELETVDLLNINNEKHLDVRFSYDLRFDRMFEKLSEQFYGWVGSLKQYDEQIFLLLFFTTLK